MEVIIGIEVDAKLFVENFCKAPLGAPQKGQSQTQFPLGERKSGPASSSAQLEFLQRARDPMTQSDFATHAAVTSP